ncbi:putative ABC transporter [Bisporella sp. PMI_857]|nr:putative ABC transporter [Bisporella sp. PMI_857]
MTWEAAYVFAAVSVACAAIFLFYLPVRLWELRTSSIKTSPSLRGSLKAALGILVSLNLLIYVTKYLLSSKQWEITFVTSLLASLLAAPGLSLLLHLEQRRSLKPSDLATLYLVAMLICDTVLLTVQSGVAAHPEISRPVQIRCCIHFVILMLELRTKRLDFNIINKQQSPEELNGVLSRAFFTWIIPILLQGYRNVLIDQDLPFLSHDIKPELTRKKILQTWSQRAKPETRSALPLTLLKCIKEPFLAAIIPRLFLIVFRYSQPILIKRSIRFVIEYRTGAVSDYGDWLIISAVVVYIGLAISTSVYQNQLNRLRLATRSALIGLIHDKIMNSPSVAYDNGESTTLMSTDADGLDGIAQMVHETWAQIVEVAVGVFLLAYEVGWIWPLPLFLIYLCSYMSRYVAKHLAPRQKAWNNATQSRIAATSSMLSSMKIIKMLGFQHYITSRVQDLRKEELLAASKLRWIMVYYNASANALGIFAPVITLVIFAVISAARGRNLDTETAFTTMAILSMVTHPANMIMTIVPRAVASFAGFDRIQAFLLRPSLRDQRGSLPTATVNGESWNQESGQLANSSAAIIIQELQIGETQLILKNIDIEVTPGSLVIISGATGSGKSTLLRTILGEIAPAGGLIKLSTRRIAYCAQKPWLPSGSIREVIHGITDYANASTSYQVDESWYRTVTDMCCLAHDLSSFPKGDETQIGSRGINMSGGQRQRVALARALFARCDIVLLDDCFSGLDGETENKVFENLFGPTGLFRQLKTTVVLVSNSAQHFQSADQIVVLGDGGIKEQGSWQDMKAKSGDIAKFTSGTHGRNDAVLSPDFSKLHDKVRAKDEAEVDLSRQTGDLTLYAYYFRYVGLTNLLLLVSSTASYSFFIIVPQYWLQVWTESSNKGSSLYIYGFILLPIISWSSTNGIMWSTIIRIAPVSGMRLHQHLLHIVTSATLSYFSETDNGSILNRFSQDIQLIDKQLPSALSSLAAQTFKLLMQVALLFFTQKWLALSLPGCMALVYLVQKIYLRTSRQLRFLELESGAAVFSSFLESVEGLETIRAFGWSRAVIQKNISSVDNAQRPEFLLSALQRWLNIVLDLLAAALATSIVATAVFFQGRISGGQVGVALNIMLVANGTLLKLVENWTALEISLGAVSRLKALEKATLSKSERSGDLEPPKNWPSKGQIALKSVTAAYNAESIILQNLSLNIDAGQKVIVCGRTGSGKSTLLSILLRMLELQSGTIELDGVDISQVSLDLLRQECFITMSQDSLLLSNETLRFNLDPEASSSDDIITDALSKTGLWPHFFGGSTGSNESLDSEATDISLFVEHPILDRKVSDFQELSGGQYQLFGLCRALVKAKTSRRAGVTPVVLLDEVTSSLDLATESTIYSIIEEEFTSKGHTVIIVAHRLGVLAEHTKPGRDFLVVMQDGRIQEVITDFQNMASEGIEET